jgi:DnaJ-class molecular chaperone
MGVCFYEILKIPRTATFKEIKKSYRKLVVRYHPDINGDTLSNNEKIKELNQAYECLSDSKKRAVYDEKFRVPDPKQKSQTSTTPSSPWFNSVYTVNLTLEEMFFGCSKQIEVINLAGVSIPYNIQIPKGVNHGWMLTVPGNHHVPEFLISVVQKAHPFYERENVDLFCTISVPYIYTLTGGEAKFNWFDGERILYIKAGAYPGVVITLPGLGMPYPNSNRYGDLHVKLRVKGLVDFESVLRENASYSC